MKMIFLLNCDKKDSSRKENFVEIKNKTILEES